MDGAGGRSLVYGSYLQNEDEEDEDLEESGDRHEPEVAELLSFQENFQKIVKEKSAHSTKINYVGHIKRFCVWLAKFNEDPDICIYNIFSEFLLFFGSSKEFLECSTPVTILRNEN